MISDKKCKLMLFVDYLIVLLLSLFGLMIFSWMLQYSWGFLLYSAFFVLVYFGMIYSRCWNKAKSDLKYQKDNLRGTKAFRLVLPLTLTLLIFVLLFVLIQYNIIPIRDLVTDVHYILEENQPRKAENVILFSSVVPVMRILFAFLNGFQPTDSTQALVFLIAPAVTVLAGFAGYCAGMKKFYLSEVIFRAQQKAKDKFNE